MNLHSASAFNYNQRVYLARAGKFLKIGVSHDPRKRRGGIQTGSPLRVTIVQQWHASSARKIEAMAHQILALHRVSGEWFDVPIKSAVLVIETLILANPRNPAARITLDKTVLFCNGCKRCATVLVRLTKTSKFKCSACGRNDPVIVAAF